MKHFLCVIAFGGVWATAWGLIGGQTLGFVVGAFYFLGAARKTYYPEE